MNVFFTPSLPAQTSEQLETLLEQLVGVATSFQVDLVDGVFATPVSWPYTKSDPYAALTMLRPWSKRYALELDAMIAEPAELLSILEPLVIKRLIIHVGSFSDITPFITKTALLGCQLTLGVQNDVPLETLYHYLDQSPGLAVQLMGIATIGEQGQAFDERTLPRIRLLRARYPDLDIGVDGAVNFTTVERLYAAGANRFAPGSVIAAAPDPVAAYKQLSDLLT